MELEIKNAINEIATAFNEFKKSNDERLAKLEKGEGVTDLEAKLDQINGKISEQEALKEKLEALEKKTARPGQFAQGKEQADEYKSAFDLFMRKGDESALEELNTKSHTAMNTGSDADGGYSVPEQLDRNISATLKDDVVMRAVSNVIPLSTGDYKKLFNLHGASSGWVGETDARPKTNGPKLAAIAPFMGEIYANPEATQKLLDDSFFSIESWLLSEIRDEFAEQEEAAFTHGDGANKPKGYLAYPMDTKKDDARDFGKLQKFTAAAANAVTGDELITLVYGLRKKYRRGARWMMNGNTIAAIRKLKDSSGEYLWQPSLQAGQPSMLMGYSISENEEMPDVAASQNAITFGDFRRGYTIVDRIGTRILRDPYTNKPFVSFYTTKRVGGMLADSNAIKVLTLKAS
ncbi:phage major capsid protein [Endozoicomonas acroporae]|uniref:phage major capsid protein n=1 Tax=Endozoicomonas acroporae TaxID=1701104 RepID=UPI003D78F417